MIDNLKFKNKESGFSLMEMIVAIGVFLIIFSIIIGIFISASRVQRKTLGLISIINDSRFVFERMGKEMRTGKTFQFPTGALNGSNKICFTNDKGIQVVYQLNATSIARYEGVCDSVLPANSKITSQNVEITYLKFYLSGETAPPDTNQPRITITAGLKSSGIPATESSTINIEKTISPIPLNA
ncbi:MAG: prepilin-type N-terminal cleavage/methylation domain-containing protein [Parcubacteria group bacterium]|nr:prepilin-type N-terminal cleavage/methylation domain-containing protein [Parcubacteria group bacterium]